MLERYLCCAIVRSIYVYCHYQNYYFEQCCFFFFQAEDGIRDLTVTGVQTCALPISSTSDRLTLTIITTTNSTSFSTPRGYINRTLTSWVRSSAMKCGPTGIPAALRRSEERRVGKECRSRWSPYH